MNNQDKDTTHSHPKPSDDAQSLVETIIPSTEDKASTTTKAEQPESMESKKNDTENEKSADVNADTKDSTELEEAKQVEQKKNNEGDKIETVAP